ncbi:patatin-like phospholipase family protein [Pseudomonas aeruginosa]|uniref:patatin-like phospholipase family protein n=1 Tax=Pseudomonas aeruginosa TaxID=287 RepID=UPI000DE996C6|nr:patatin-like phospholipase family protein [Pseudomonas aeruginosa]RCH63166.1 patatin-like phospholipase family protein [Pseudomonas aeruginosa]
MSDPLAPRPPLTGLILSGGGARAAYQVGVLAAIADLLPDSAGNPFPVIVGTSAGAINAVGLACGALQFRQAIQRLTAVWQGFRTEHVYRSDWPGVTRQASRFLGHSLLGLGRRVPVALLDNRPLHELLARELDFSGIHAALHLGATRVLVIGVSGNPATGGDSAMTGLPPSDRPPSLAQIGAHLLNSTFIDSLEGDIEQLQRMNQIGQLVAPEVRRQAGGLEPVEVLLVSPSRPLDEIAARHYRELSRVLRLFLRGPGATRASGAGVLSYLLFERGYCSELIELGYHDAMGKRAELERFLRIER